MQFLHVTRTSWQKDCQPAEKEQKISAPCNRGQGLQKTQQNTSLTWNAQYCDTELQPTKSANGCNSSKIFLTESELQWLAVMARLRQQDGSHWWTRNQKKAWFLIAKISSTEITRPEENAYDTNPSNHRSSMFSSNPHTIARNGHVQVPGPAETSKTTEHHQSTKNIWELIRKEKEREKTEK